MIEIILNRLVGAGGNGNGNEPLIVKQAGNGDGEQPPKPISLSHPTEARDPQTLDLFSSLVMAAVIAAAFVFFIKRKK